MIINFVVRHNDEHRHSFIINGKLKRRKKNEWENKKKTEMQRALLNCFKNHHKSFALSSSYRIILFHILVCCRAHLRGFASLHRNVIINPSAQNGFHIAAYYCWVFIVKYHNHSTKCCYLKTKQKWRSSAINLFINLLFLFVRFNATNYYVFLFVLFFFIFYRFITWNIKSVFGFSKPKIY